MHGLSSANLDEKSVAPASNTLETTKEDVNGAGQSEEKHLEQPFGSARIYVKKNGYPEADMEQRWT